MIDNSVQILYTKIPDEFLLTGIPDGILLPESLNYSPRNYREVKDSLRNLFGRLLIARALWIFGFDVRLPGQEITLNEYGRPRVHNKFNIDFNVSHSGYYITCAISRGFKVGIDIEEIKEVNMENYTEVMSHEEWRIIRSANNKIKVFFDYWTMKEAVIKAMEMGFSFDLKKIKITPPVATAGEDNLTLTRLDLDSEYAAYLAVKTGTIANTSQQIKIQFLEANELIMPYKSVIFSKPSSDMLCK